MRPSRLAIAIVVLFSPSLMASDKGVGSLDASDYQKDAIGIADSTVAGQSSALQTPVEDGSKQSWWQHVVLTIITTTGAVAVPVLTTLLIVLLRRWNVRLEYDKAEWVARKGADFAEQAARNYLRGGQPLDGGKTMHIALTQSRKLATGTLAPWATAALEGLIEAHLGAQNRDKPKPTPEHFSPEDTEQG